MQEGIKNKESGRHVGKSKKKNDGIKQKNCVVKNESTIQH